MGITLDEVLLMVGRLDDTPGFDSSRERFRRFLVTHVTDVRVVRAFIEQCQRSLGEQHHRALKDLVTLLGRFIGLETAFGSYVPIAGGLRYDGHWRYPRRMNVVLEVRTDQTSGADIENLSRSVAALAASSLLTANPPPLGLTVIASHYPRRALLEQTIESRPNEPVIKAVTIRSLLALADMVQSGRVKHAEVLRILGSDLAIDFLIDLLARPASGDGTSRGDATGGIEEAGCWIAVVVSDAAATPQQILERVVGKRRIFGLPHTGERHAVARPGDQICFHVPGAGIVGHAEVISVAEDGVGIRDASRFSHVLHLGEPQLHLTEPVPPSPETQRRLDAAASSAAAQILVRISAREFLELTAVDRSAPQDAGPAALTAADSRSRE